MSGCVNVGTIESFDLEEHCEALSPTWNVEFKQLSRGPFQARLDYLQCDDVLCYSERWGQRLQVQGTSPAGFFMFGVAATPGLIWDGIQVEHDSLPVKHSAEAVDFSGSQNHAVLLVRPAALEACLGEEQTAALMARKHTVGCDRRASVRLGQTIRRLIERCAGHLSSVDMAREGRSIEREVLSLLEGLAEPETSQPTRRGKSNRQRAYQRALELTSTQGFSHTIPMLARQVGVSQRTLELAFQEAIGMPPSKYLRWARLNGLRRDLLHADPATATVTQLGFGWGFCELGRMAVEYRRLFGEPPSLTLFRRPTSPETLLTPRPRSAAQAPEHHEPYAYARTGLTVHPVA